MPTALCATSTPRILEWRPTSPSAASTCWLPSGTSWTLPRKAAATGTPVSTTAQKSRPPPSRFISNARSIISTVRIVAFAVSQAQLSPHPATPETALSRIKAHIEALLSRGNAVSISGGSRANLPLCQCIPFARKRGVLSRRSASGSGSLVARHRQVHAPCEAETGNGHKRRSAKQADRHGVLGYKGARRKRLAHRNPSRGRRECEPPNMSHTDRGRMVYPPHETRDTSKLDRPLLRLW